MKLHRSGPAVFAHIMQATAVKIALTTQVCQRKMQMLKIIKMYMKINAYELG